MDKSVQQIVDYLESLPPGQDQQAVDILKRTIGAMNAGAVTVEEVKQLAKLRGDELLAELERLGLKK